MKNYPFVVPQRIVPQWFRFRQHLKWIHLWRLCLCVLCSIVRPFVDPMHLLLILLTLCFDSRCGTFHLFASLPRVCVCVFHFVADSVHWQFFIHFKINFSVWLLFAVYICFCSIYLAHKDITVEKMRGADTERERERGLDVTNLP